MLAHQIIGDDVADAVIKRRRALEIGEQEGEAGDLQPLVDVERVGLIDVAEGLVGQQPLRGQERPAIAEQVMELVAGDPYRRQRAHVGAVLERDPQRTGPHRRWCRSGRESY